MSEIRKGDTIIPKSMDDEFIVQRHDHETATAKNGRGQVRDFQKDDLECVDPDDGLWQEMIG